MTTCEVINPATEELLRGEEERREANRALVARR